MYNALSEIKEMLFDAPSEVKESFNVVAQYFANYSNIKSALKDIDGISDIEKDPDQSLYTFKYKNNKYAAWNGPDMYLVLVQRMASDNQFSVETKKNTVLCNVKDLKKVIESL